MEFKKRNNSKKILIIVVLSIILALICVVTILLKKNHNYQITDLTLKEGYKTAYIVGKVKNISGKKCKILTINYEYINGSLKEEDSILITDIENNETRDIDNFTSINNSDIDNYTIKVGKINCLD